MQFIKKSSASSVGYTEKVTKARVDPSPCTLAPLQGREEAAVHCCHPGRCGIPEKEGNAALAVCAQGWEAAGLLGSSWCPTGWTAERMGMLGTAQRCSQGQHRDIPRDSTEVFPGTAQGYSQGQHRDIPSDSTEVSPGTAQPLMMLQQKAFPGGLWCFCCSSQPSSDSKQEAVGKFRHLQG